MTTLLVTPIATTIDSKRIRIPPRVNLGEITPANLGTLKKLNSVLFPVRFSDKFYKDVLDLEISPEVYNQLVFYQDLAVGNLISRLEPLLSPLPTASTSNLLHNNASEEIPTTKQSTTTNTIIVEEGVEIELEEYRLYIMTLGILAPYRRQHLATHLLSHLLTTASASHLPSPPSTIKIKLPDPLIPVPSSSDTKDTRGAVEKKKKEKVAAEKEKKKEGMRERRKVVKGVYCHVQTSNLTARGFWEGNGFVVKETIPDYYKKIEPTSAWLMERLIEKPVAVV